MKIVDFSKSGTGDLFEFNVNIKDIHIGDGALAGNLMKVFDVEGSENLLSGSFSADAAEVDAVMSKDGNVKFKVKPKANGGKMPDRFFFRVKMK